MQRIIFIILSYCCVSSTWAQINTFNKRFHFDMPAVILTSVFATDSCYYATGVVVDSIPPNRRGNTFIKFDLEGNPLFIKSLFSTEQTYETFFPNLKPTPDSNFVVAGYSFTNTQMLGLLIKYNTNGDTIFTTVYEDPFDYPNHEYYRVDELAVTNDHKYITGGSAIRVQGIDDIVITTINQNGAIEKIESHITHNFTSSVRKLIPLPDKGYIVGGQVDNFSLSFWDFYSEDYIFKIDSSGTQEWRYYSPEGDLMLGVQDMILETDGSLIVASLYGEEIQPAPDNPSDIFFQTYIYKLNSQRQRVWETFIRENTWHQYRQLRKLIKCTDESGYIVVGGVFENSEEELVNPNVEIHDWGMMAKISPTGDSLWHRYHYIPLDDQNQHEIYDIKETADGGFIMCGLSLQASFGGGTSDGTGAFQQGWLVKVDEHGCLVPGCHLPDAVDTPSDAIRLQIYPNPTTDFLNIFLKTKERSKDGQFRVVDINGREVKTFEPKDVAEITYSLPVYDMAKGIYFLQYSEGNDLRYTEKFIVQ